MLTFSSCYPGAETDTQIHTESSRRSRVKEYHSQHSSTLTQLINVEIQQDKNDITRKRCVEIHTQKEGALL